MATAAHKIISANIIQVNIPSKVSSKRTSVSSVGSGIISPIYSTKVTRGFLDAVYNLFDGLMLLASDESPAVLTTNDMVETKIAGESVISELYDLTDGVSFFLFLSALTGAHILLIGRQAVASHNQSGTP